MEKYDAIIIGAGIGGLSCGARLAKSGLRTLVLEQHHTVGGCCSTFRKKGFSFDLAALFLFEGPSLITNNLKELDVKDKVDFIQIDPLYQYIFPDFEIKVPKDIESFSKELVKIAPGEEKNIHDFFKEIIKIHKLIEEIRFKPPYEKRNVMANLFSHPELIRYGLRYGGMTWDKFLDHYFTNKKLKAILSVESIFLGLPPSKIPAIAMAFIIAMEHTYGLVYPRNGMVSLAEAYVTAIKKHDGEVRLNSKVSRIIIENEKCCGVELSNGEKISSKIVVSNAEPRETFLNLAGRDNLNSKFSRAIEDIEPSLSGFKVCIGTDIKPPIEPFILKCPTYDIEALYENIWKYGIMDEVYYLISTPSLLDTSMAPAGAHSIQVLTITPFKINGSMRPEPDTAYKDKMKTNYIRKIIKDVTRIIPGLENHILYMDAITPVMLERTTIRQDGRICVNTKILDKIARNRTPIKDLYIAGSGAYPGGGVNNTILSGIITSRMILEDAGQRAVS
ncbi:MAG: NAD(P)/FAD-dependent oxidoreductase [Candidatus Methanoperedens sp.]|nr:NAD(P)/FAD-dependent oxidoreductase [Candidatus Methanoperedens sp.]